ncbi:MAG: hypothetical protein AVDCRST_MAG66-591 [uncultured Pseudonocardia sp.]|uniref:Uncharacterized protein n=1 Tax=uncultured Pseudonocardia sp. TaxID=211455 RepID=A0A6J4NKH5_9PSEU|nr:MAG: hypothetical protein AVDCRST_MAG66-591 [uncultured Pseudonocardia sp.]
MVEVLAALSPVLLALGIVGGRLSITLQQRIVRVRQERHRLLLRTWQDELERREGCRFCREL